jgi:hypothetical protein
MAKVQREAPMMRMVRLGLVGLICWAVLAYLILPRLWVHHEHQPGLAHSPAVTVTPDGIPGDPLNVGLVGSEADVLAAMHAAGWYPADPITLRSSVKIVASVMLDRPDVQAPVSTLLYEGRKEDLAFEKPIGSSADQRNHVRFWKVLDKGAEGRPVWLGSATQDAGVELSRTTGQVTHHIARDVDAERQLFIQSLTEAKMVEATYQVSGVGPTVNGRNGGGDRYHTDGEIHVAVLSPGAKPVDGPPKVEAEPTLVLMKDQVWAAVAGAVGG